LFGSRGQKMKVEVAVVTYLGGAAQRWHRLSGKGRGGLGGSGSVTFGRIIRAGSAGSDRERIGRRGGRGVIHKLASLVEN
jgi:hypothetical protein